MKKFLVTFTLALFFLAVSQGETLAQHYYTYDGDSFNVLLTSNNDDTRITSVKFSYEGKWVEFKIVDFQNLEDTDEGGFLYTVLDGKNRKFTIDYYRDQDYIIVTDVQDGEEWTLYRRQ